MNLDVDLQLSQRSTDSTPSRGPPGEHLLPTRRPEDTRWGHEVRTRGESSMWGTPGVGHLNWEPENLRASGMQRIRWKNKYCNMDETFYTYFLSRCSLSLVHMCVCVCVCVCVSVCTCRSARCAAWWPPAAWGRTGGSARRLGGETRTFREEHSVVSGQE